jgi:hypothetical protein
MTGRLAHPLLCALALSASMSAAATHGGNVRSVHLDLTLHIDPSTRALRADALLRCECSGIVTVSLGSRFSVDQITVDEVPSRTDLESANEPQRWRIALPAETASHRIALRYRGELAPLAQADERGVLGGLPPMTDARGTFLPAGSGWYPELDADTFTYRLTLELPAGQSGLVAGRLLSESTEASTYRAQFELDHPAEGIDLVAGPYRMDQRLAGNVAVRTYFHPEIGDLSGDYLSAAAGYLVRYGNAIGSYPYTGFSIVSSPLPTGLGMPSFTYLGIDVLRLPFIRTTSLGHEVLHNWWGNGVYVDWQHGNWSEGLTTFMADYAYKEDESEAAAREMRLTWLRDFAAVPVERDRALRAFTSRTHDASQIVGYDKSAFLFLMLRDEISRDAFDAALRQFFAAQKFHRASWADLEHAFARQSGRDLRAFFTQWLDRNGAPALKVEQATAQTSGSGYRVQAIVAQADPPYRLRLPIAVETERGTEEHIVHLDSARQQVDFATQGRPRTLTIDPALRVFRRLDARELPPIVRQVTLDPATVTIVATRNAEVESTARALAQRLMDTEPRFGERLPRDASVIVFGLQPDVDAWLAQENLAPEPEPLRNRGSAQVWTAQLPNGKTMLAISARDATALQALLRPLPHYGKQSWLVFDGAKAVDRGVWEVKAVSWRFE